MSIPGFMPVFSAVAWDIDGTLVDSEPLHHRALVAASKGFGVDLADLPDMAFRGVHMGDVWKRLQPRFPPGLAEQAWLDAINRHYIEHRHSLTTMPGAVETVRMLADLGIPQVCVSNSCRAVVDANLDAMGIASSICFSVSLDDVTEGKPSPIPYRMAAERLGLPAGSIIAIEDSFTGLASARAAGLFAVFYTAHDEATAAEGAGVTPDMTVTALSEIVSLFSVERAGSLARRA
ncbi:HAD family hydrolase [Rhizobium cremeum]|uniref:HAD family hydrolase n=1 Tax=Rhizobium cremeum TaxID=2813827 RepID=UPI001FD50A50